MYKAAILLALVAAASAGIGNVAYLDHHIGNTAEQTVRGFGGLSSVSTQSRAVNSAYTSSSAYKTKVTNNALSYAPALAAAPVAYAQPAIHAAPVAYAQPAIHAAPALAYAQPALAKTIASPLGVAYSPVVPGVATLSFDGFGVHYGY